MANRVKLHDISQEQAHAMGAIVLSWAQVEDITMDLIARLLANSLTAGYAICSNMDFGRRHALLLAVSDRLPSHFADKMRDLLKRANEVYTLRNLIAHAAWVKAERKDYIKPMEFRARGKIKYKGHLVGEKSYRAKDFRKAAEDLQEIIYELYELTETLVTPPTHIPFTEVP